jgi:translation initiation factor IF-3
MYRRIFPQLIQTPRFTVRYAASSSHGVVKNEEIKYPTLRVVMKDATTNQNTTKVLSRTEALSTAKKLGLDLILVQKDADPPVCRFENFGKIIQKTKEREKQMRQHQKSSSLKEILIKIGIDPHDLQTKMRKVKEFIDDGHPVKLNVFLRRKAMGKTAKHVQKNPHLTNLPLLDLDELTLQIYSQLENLQIIMQQKDVFDEKQEIVEGQLEPNIIRIHMKREILFSPKKKNVVAQNINSDGKNEEK